MLQYRSVFRQAQNEFIIELEKEETNPAKLKDQEFEYEGVLYKIFGAYPGVARSFLVIAKIIDQPQG